MKRVSMATAITLPLLLGTLGCASLPDGDTGARPAPDRVTVLGSRIPQAREDVCETPRTASPVTTICNDELLRTGAPDVGNAIKGRVPYLRWGIGH